MVADADEAIGKADHSVREAHSKLVPAPGRKWRGNRRKAFRILFHLNPPEARLCSSTDQNRQCERQHREPKRPCELPSTQTPRKTVLAPKTRAGFARGLRARSCWHALRFSSLVIPVQPGYCLAYMLLRPSGSGQRSRVLSSPSIVDNLIDARRQPRCRCVSAPGPAAPRASLAYATPACATPAHATPDCAMPCS